MRGLSSILSHFRNEFNKFNQTGVRFYLSQDIKLLKTRIFGVKTSIFCHLLRASVDNHIPHDDIFNYQPLREYNIYMISSLPGNALRKLADIARLGERFNMRFQSRA